MSPTLHAVANWVYRFFGFSGIGAHYGFWSGAGSDIGEVAILGGVVQLYRRHNCQAPRCLRLSRHPAADGLYSLCGRHHPDIPDGKLTLDHIHAAHARAKEKT